MYPGSTLNRLKVQTVILKLASNIAIEYKFRRVKYKHLNSCLRTRQRFEHEINKYIVDIYLYHSPVTFQSLLFVSNK